MQGNSWRRAGAAGAAVGLAVVAGAGAFTAAATAGTPAQTLPSYQVKQLALGTQNPIDGGYGDAVSPDGKTLYVAAIDGGLKEIPLAHPSQMKTVDLCTGPDSGGPVGPVGVAISPNGTTAYVGCPLAGEVQAINLKNGRVTDITWSRGVYNQPAGVALSPNGKILYIAESDGDSGPGVTTAPAILVADVSGSGAKNDTVIGSVSGTSTTVDGATELALSPNGRTLYAGGFDQSHVTVANVAKVSVSHPNAGAVTTTIPMPTGTAGTDNGVGVGGLAVSDNGQSLYAADLGTGDVEAVNVGGGAGNNTVVGTVFAGSSDPWGLALAPGGSDLYVVNEPDSSETSTVDQIAIPAFSSVPMISGTPTVGMTLKVSAAKSTQATAIHPSTKLAYHWYANGHAIAGATTPRLKLTAALTGKRITVTATPAAVVVGFNDGPFTSAATKKVVR